MGRTAQGPQKSMHLLSTPANAAHLAGYWSRRIDETHRLVYAADDADFDVIACRGHYDD
jgi:hypothetical protein